MPFGYASHVPGGLQFGNCGSGFFLFNILFISGCGNPQQRDQLFSGLSRQLPAGPSARAEPAQAESVGGHEREGQIR